MKKSIFLILCICNFVLSAGFNENVDIRNGKLRLYGYNNSVTTELAVNYLSFHFPANIYNVQDGGLTSGQWYIPSLDIPNRYDAVNFGQLVAVLKNTENSIKPFDNSGKDSNCLLTFGSGKNYIYGNKEGLFVESLSLIKVNTPNINLNSTQEINIKSLLLNISSQNIKINSDIFTINSRSITLGNRVTITPNDITIGDMIINNDGIKINKKLDVIGSKIYVSSGGQNINNMYLQMQNSSSIEMFEPINVGQFLNAINILQNENTQLKNKVNELEKNLNGIIELVNYITNR